jgi:predicted nuclease of predicted toxin-antitoxin system
VKIVFDQNISYRIISKIIVDYPHAKQVKQLGIVNYSDIEIWDYAKKNEYTIITFDSDFFDFANIKGHPPKIIWLRIGNTKTDFLAEILKEKYSIILDFIQSDNYSEIACLEIK